MGVEYQADRSVLLKILLHAAAHPSQSVNGVLLGKMPSKNGAQAIQILEVLPFFHAFPSLAPMTEVALIQADEYANRKGLTLVGYYHANEQIDDLEFGPVARKLADKVHVNSPQSCALLVDNSKLKYYLQGKASHFLQVFSKDPQKGSWAVAGSNLQTADAAGVPQLFLSYHEEGRHQELVDFHDHLNDIRKDWTNPTLLS